MKKSIFTLLCCLGISHLYGQSVYVPRDAWRVLDASSVQANSSEKAFDGDTSTHWHTNWGEEKPLPHHLAVDLGDVYEVNGFRYIPRPDGGNGCIKEYDFYVSSDGKEWGDPVSTGVFEKRNEPNEVTFPAVKGVRYVKLVAKKGFNADSNYASAAEIYVYQKSDKKPVAQFSVPSKVVKTGRSLIFQDKSTISPIEWEWEFPGGTPSTSHERHPKVTYEKPGVYDVILKVTNQNGTTTLHEKKMITVSDQVKNSALCLDGKDNQARINQGIIKDKWTLEAWVKGDDSDWNTDEVIIGAGEYRYPRTLDAKPLMLKKGCLASPGAKIFTQTPLDDSWHHVAVSCDGKTTRLYLDGKEVGSSPTVNDLLPGTIGVDERNSTFGGLIDEVRIWNEALSPETLNQWKGRPLSPQHPNFATLKGYYPFDDMTDEMSVNWVGRGHQPYHVLNGRIDFKGKAPVAYTVPNNNPQFKEPIQNQSVFNAVVIPSEWDVDMGTKDDQVLKVRVAVQGGETPLSLDELTLDLSSCTDLKDIEKVHVYYTGNMPRPTVKQELFGSGKTPEKIMTFKANKLTKGSLKLTPGINYILVAFDMSPKAQWGNTVKATVPSMSLSGKKIQPLADDTCYDKLVTSNSANDPNLFKVLQWNIWHGGVHVVEGGPDRIVDLMRLSHADIVTMQESYGSQEKFAADLSWNLHTDGSGANLAMYTPLPIEKLKSKRGFNSNPAKVTLKNGEKVFVTNVWLRYAYRPEYTCGYLNSGWNPEDFVKEDAELSLKDIEYIISTDINPNLDSPDMPVIIGGDFNSGSDLDWTEKAKHLHNGYVAALPTSIYMREQGFRDTFREIHPDEVKRPEGTFAVVYGHLQHSRIDFIYAKGDKIKTRSSKCVRSHPEIDYVWPGDHAAVLTIFESLPGKKD